MVKNPQHALTLSHPLAALERALSGAQTFSTDGLGERRKEQKRAAERTNLAMKLVQ